MAAARAVVSLMSSWNPDEAIDEPIITRVRWKPDPGSELSPSYMAILARSEPVFYRTHAIIDEYGEFGNQAGAG
jgi:hypothetical protein